jgi:glutamyl-tRNA reductase
MRLSLIGISHHSASVEIREQVVLDLDDAAALARSLAGSDGEAVCLSTCNRTELYFTGDSVVGSSALEELAGRDLDDSLYHLADEEAALHLFRVAAGLDSLVPGEGEILGQVRAAYEHGRTGPLLDRVFHQALHVGKRVRTETAIGESPASVSSAAAALAQQVFGDLEGRHVLLIGAGKIGELTAQALASRGARIALVASRTLDRAEGLARRFGGEALPLERIEQELGRADVVVAASSSPRQLVTQEQVARALSARRGRPLFLIDIAVPRDLDPAINDLEGCYVYDIDDLEAVVAETLAGRRREAERAEALVAEEAARFRAWRASLDVVPAIQSLRARAEEIRAAELAKLEGRLSDEERRTVESVTAQIVNKLLHLPTVRMKQAAAATDGPAYVDVVRDLFGLEEREQ